MALVEALEILAPGPLTTVQDLGRYGFSRYGVPPSGAVDSFSLRVANLLVGNPEGEGALEITLMGLRVRALTDLTVAVTGADLRPHQNGEALPAWRSHVFKSGDILSFGTAASGCRAYLALGGGIALDPVMGSKSTNLSSRFGGVAGRALRQGDILFCRSPQLYLAAEGRALKDEWIPFYGKRWTLRVLPGPQGGDFPEASVSVFLDALFTVTPQLDRTGIRLSGPLVQRKPDRSESIISEGVVPGAIQIPGDAQPIILLAETVTGGYRKIANVISADLPFLGQMKPGDMVRFQEVSLQEALEALHRTEEIVHSLRSS